MSNSIEFYHAQSNMLGTGAAVTNVYLDGEYFDFIVLQRIVFAGNSDFNHAVLKAANQKIHEIRCGQKIVINTIYDSGIGVSCIDEITIFSGFIEQIEIAEEITIRAEDYSCRLKRKTVYGQFIGLQDGQTMLLESAATIFNPDGKGNLSSISHQFASEGNGKLFKCADAINYLLLNYVSKSELVIPTLTELRQLTNNCGITDVDVTGLNLIEALARCCKQAGLRFKFVPSEAKEAIVFYRPGQGREVELNCQYAGEKLDISKTNISEFARRKYNDITNRYIVQGDYKIYEATFNLVKGWDAALEANDYDRYSPNTNENFNEVRDVYRKWVLNEVGDYNPQPAYDFSQIFQTSNYVRKKRRFFPTLTCGEDGSSIGYYLEVSYTNGSKWWPYMNSFKVLLDQCGIWLSVEQLDTNLWFAIVKGVLKVRITACAASDERISYIAANGPVCSNMEVEDEIITLPKRFKYQKVSPQSIFANGKAAEIDNTKDIVEYANLCLHGKRKSEDVEVKTMTLCPYYSPGDIITSRPESRDVLGVMYDSANVCFVEKVHVDFEKQQTIINALKRRK